MSSSTNESIKLMTVLQAQSECQPYWVIGPQRSALTSNDTILVQSRLGVYSSIAIILELSLNCKPSTLALLLLAWCLHILNPHTLLSVAACSYEQPFNANLHTSQISDTDRVEEADCSQWFVQRCKRVFWDHLLKSANFHGEQ